MTATTTKQPAHRPSRRDEIIQTAIRVFAENGYAEAAISDIAEAARAQADIDGGLIGGASLKAPDFLQIIAAAR